LADSEPIATAPARPGELLAPRRRLLVWGAGSTTVLELPERGAVVLGRAQECELRVEHPSVSRRHCRFQLDEAGITVEDLGGTNPTLVNGRPIERGVRAALSPGQLVRVGEVVLVLSGGPDEAGPERGDGARGEEGERPSRPAPVLLPEGLVAVDPITRRLLELVARIGPGEVPVLLHGETGVGKELFAEAIHRASRRAAGPLVKVNCAALSPSLLEAELFGHEKGAFTGAERARAGLFEAAAGGTIFLDEVGDLPAAAQAALLRVLEAREVLPVGGRKPRPVDVRVVSATHKDLRAEAERGGFRRDLYFRLDGFSLTLPPLRARPADLSPLVLRFAAAARPGGGAAVVSDAAMAAMAAYAWPGNARELRHAVAAAALLAGDAPIEVEHLPAAVQAAASGEARASPIAGIRDELAEVERQRIIAALEAAGGNQTKAAAILGMPRRTFLRRLAEYRLRGQ
jgi:two-component system, NtrC family, response regulator AtoC